MCAARRRAYALLERALWWRMWWRSSWTLSSVMGPPCSGHWEWVFAIDQLLGRWARRPTASFRSRFYVLGTERAVEGDFVIIGVCMPPGG